MDTGIVRQAIMDSQNNVVGYEILYKEDDGSLYNRSDSAAANAIESFLNSLDSISFLEDKPAYFTFTPNLLLKSIPSIFDKEKVVIQIEDNSIIHPQAQEVIYDYKNRGYKVAVKGFQFASRFFSILDVVDIMKMDFSSTIDQSFRNVIEIGKNLNKTIIGYNINSESLYMTAKALGCHYFQGSYIAKSRISTVSSVNHLESNLFQLVVEITRDEPNIDKIAEIISRDVTLTFSLIKLVNSAYFALRNRVNSVKQALVVLGIDQLKQWIYLLSFRQNSTPANAELIKLSFLRGSHCQELLPYAANMPIKKSEAYLLGMFTTLDIILGVPLKGALDELAISDHVKEALISGEGRVGTLLKLVLSYEKADWKEVALYAEELSIPYNILSQKYLECVDSVNETWNSLMIPIN